VKLPKDWFFVIYNLFTLAGDSVSRKLMYLYRPRNPLVFLGCTAVGAVLCLVKIPVIAPIGIFLVFFGNGAVYATTTRNIDSHVPKQFNLVVRSTAALLRPPRDAHPAQALSFWLFIGDFGSVAGSNCAPYIRDVVCPQVGTYLCQSS
jgi:hypothetical protein